MDDKQKAKAEAAERTKRSREIERQELELEKEQVPRLIYSLLASFFPASDSNSGRIFGDSDMQVQVTLLDGSVIEGFFKNFHPNGVVLEITELVKLESGKEEIKDTGLKFIPLTNIKFIDQEYE